MSVRYDSKADTQARSGADPKSDPGTRQRLLDAAGPVFAERGFQDATVREICARAGANVAAVHYHFGDKLELYHQTLSRCVREGLERFPIDGGLPSSAPVDERLHAFVRSFLLRILGDGRPDWQGQLIAREMMEPTGALDRFVEEQVRPLFKHLCGLVSEILGERAEPARVILAARSVVGQCVFYHHSRPVLERLAPGERFDLEHLERLARHVAEFSLSGLRGLGAAGRESAP